MAAKLAQPIIVAEKLTRVYALGESRVAGIDRIDFKIAQGELVVLKGDSGSGKSTLLSLLAGLDHPTDGKLRVAGCDLSNAGRAELTRFRRHVVGMVFQSFNLMPTLTAFENTCLPGLLAGKDAKNIKKKALNLLERLGLSERIDHFPAQLSGGEMQRTAIARALINDPEIVLADEPTGNLDSVNGQRVMDLLARVNREWKRTVIIATHGHQADAAATLGLFLKDGKLMDRPCTA